MKSIKFMAPAIAFVLAIGTALASDSLSVRGFADARGSFYPSANCVIGDLQAPPPGKTCDTIYSYQQCRVRIPVGLVFQIVPAYTLGGTCTPAHALFYDF